MISGPGTFSVGPELYVTSSKGASESRETKRERRQKAKEEVEGKSRLSLASNLTLTLFSVRINWSPRQSQKFQNVCRNAFFFHGISRQMLDRIRRTQRSSWIYRRNGRRMTLKRTTCCSNSVTKSSKITHK